MLAWDEDEAVSTVARTALHHTEVGVTITMWVALTALHYTEVGVTITMRVRRHFGY